MYFEDNKEFLAYIKNHGFIGLSVKVIFSKDARKEVNRFFVPPNKKRKYLAQSLDDLTNNIIMEQTSIIESGIAKFIRHGSRYIVQN